MRHPVTYALAAVALFAFLAGNAAADPKFEGRKKCSSCHKSQA
ncbi:MAG TPA: cytochrome C554, partial [Candidatus Poseidoniales archaeon]